jgi:arylsulfatase A-like enzyme
VRVEARGATLLWIAFAALGVGACGATPARPPNAIVIVADDLGYADLGAQGSPDVVTPNIDAIARDGVRFRAGYVTSPQCSPSRAGLLTGRYPNRYGFEYNFMGQWDKGLDPAERTLANLLGNAGYATGMVGKWHLGKTEAMRPGARGFAETLWHPNGGVHLPDAATGRLPGLFRGSEPAELRGYETDVFTDEAIAFIERHRDEPFFLYLAYAAPHWPMEAKPEQLARFAHVEDLHRRAFLAMMGSLDESVGRLMQALRAANLEQQTLVIFLSDNGGATGAPRSRPDAPFEHGANASSNAPFRGGKRDLLEGGIRVPFLLQWKGHIPAGLVFDPPVSSLDVLPTVLAAADVARPAWRLDGVDLLPFLRGERSDPPHEALFWRFDFLPTGTAAPRRWAIRAGDWKLVKNAREPLALYDLRRDPAESRNLADRDPERVAALRAQWQAWNAEMKPPAWPPQGAGAPAE